MNEEIILYCLKDSIKKFNYYLQRDFNREYNHLIGVYINFLQKSLKKYSNINHKTILDLNIGNIQQINIVNNNLSYMKFKHLKTWNNEFTNLIDILMGCLYDCDFKSLRYDDLENIYNEIFEKIEIIKF